MTEGRSAVLKNLSREELEEALRVATSRRAKTGSPQLTKVPAGLDRVLAAIAHPRIRLIVEMLRLKPRTAGEIASEMKLQPGVVSRYLTDLREAGITEEQKSNRDGRERIISIKEDAFAIVDLWINQNSADPQRPS